MYNSMDNNYMAIVVTAQWKINRLMTKPTKWYMCPAKTQISLGIRPVWSESSLCAQWVAKDSSFLHADSKDSDRTGRIPRLIWVFAGCTCHFVGFIMRWPKCSLTDHVDQNLRFKRWQPSIDHVSSNVIVNNFNEYTLFKTPFSTLFYCMWSKAILNFVVNHLK